MAQKVTVALVDDLHGGPANETVRFRFDGTDYEIDLNSKNADAFRRNLLPFIEHARRAGRSPAGGPARPAARRKHGGDIRTWARDRGIPISDRGRISASVAEQYQAEAQRH